MMRLRTIPASAGCMRRPISTTPGRLAKRRTPSGFGNDIHRPSLSGSSVGHLLSEISGSKPGMEGLRPEGQTMSEEQRTFARRVVTWVMGVPLVLGTGLVGGQWIMKKRSED